MDELRDLAEGRLPAAREAELRARCESDPDLRARLEAYLEAHALTRAADVKPPVCRVRFEEMETTLTAHRTRAGLTRLAASLLLGAGIALGAWRLAASPGPSSTSTTAVALRAIPLDEEAIPADPAIPDFLVDYRPVDATGIRWIECFETGKAVARVAGRPVLLFLQVPSCPMCIDMKARTFTDEEVRRRLDGFVPVMVNIMNASREVQARMKEGWPWFGSVDEEGHVLLAFPGVRGPAEFVPRLDAAARLSPSPALPWDRLDHLVARLLAARDSEQGGWLGDAYEEYAALSRECPDGPLREAAGLGLRRLTQRARAALLGARELVAGGAGIERALEALRAQIDAFEGSPYADDLKGVQDRLRTHGAFPEVRVGK